MTSAPVLNPEIPYVGEVEGGLMPGKMLKVQGKTTPNAVRFAINYQLGPNINPRDDIAIHLSPRFPEGFVTRNSIESMSWGPEENGGPMWLRPGEEFEIILLCEQLQYKIAINGRHFTEFAHRLPYQKVTHLVIDGDVEVKSITYEIIHSGPPRSPRSVPVPDVPTADFGPPAPGGLYPTLGPQGLGPAGGGGYGPPPDAYGGPPGPGYNPPRAYGYQPGYEKPEEEEAFGGCLDKVGLAVGGLIAAGGVAAAMHAYNKKKEHEKEEEHEKSDVPKSESSEGSGLNLGALGAALASSLASNALQDTRQQSGGYPPHDSGAGGMLGSLLGAFGGGGGGGGGQHPQGYPQQPPPPSDPLGGALGSILGGVLGGGGAGHQQQQPGGYGGYQPAGGYQPGGGYQPSGGYGSQQQGAGGDLLSGLGSAIGSSLLSSALDGLSKRKSQHGEDDRHSSAPPPNYGNYGGHSDPQPQHHQPASPHPANPPASSGGKFNAADISKGLGLGDDED